MEGNWFGWLVGSTYFSVGEHSEVADKAKEPQRLILNFDSMEVKKEFERITLLGAGVIKEPYEMQGMWIGNCSDPTEADKSFKAQMYL